jgi:hypothetical protein
MVGIKTIRNVLRNKLSTHVNSKLVSAKCKIEPILLGFGTRECEIKCEGPHDVLRGTPKHRKRYWENK